MDDLIDAAEAARRLGVKRATLYAYVSRGLLTSRRSPGGRESLFEGAEVERLAAQARARRRSGSMDAWVESAITLIDPAGGLYYRGVDAAELARSASFEETAELLWSGRRTVDEPFDVPRRAGAAAVRALGAIADRARPVERIGVALAAACVVDRSPYGRGAEELATAGRRILAIEVAAAGALAAGERDATGGTGRSIAARLFAALTGRPGSAAELRALDAALVLLADHELSSSTVAARVAASTWAGPYLVVSAGLAAAGGPLQAGIGDQVAAWLRRRAPAGGRAAPVRSGGRLLGFGHPLYQQRDPRAEALWPLLVAAWPTDPVLGLAGELAAGTTSFATVDLALGALVAAAGMIDGSAEAIFAVARTAGWLAHAGEEYGHGLRYRLRAAYTGPAPAGRPSPVGAAADRPAGLREGARGGTRHLGG